MLNIKIVNRSKHPLPEYATPQSAGLDLRANLSEDVTLPSLGRALIKTGLFIQLPQGYEAQIRPRSGLALKHGLSLANCVGTIDADYRGEIGVIMINLSNDPYTIQDGDRIAQMVIAQVEQVQLETVLMLDESERLEGGFGSTGKN